MEKFASFNDSIYGNMVNNMKTTIDLPDELLVAAKMYAAEHRTTLRALVSRGLRRELESDPGADTKRELVQIAWVVAKGGLPPGIDPSDRERMHEQLSEDR